jgi:hypothetical protein
VNALRTKLTDYLVATGDPRFGDTPAPFDDYPYRAEYLTQRLKEAGYPRRH